VFTLYPEYDWGVIAAWAWAYPIIIDHLETKSYIDAGKIVATGHSRGGKTALCAGVYEERIAVTAPNSSGTGGTGSWRYFDPEYRQQWLSYHIDSHRHWWHANMFYFSGNEERLPFDAHFQKALIAPRGLFNAHSSDDHWANPYGTYLTYLGAEIVYEWLGAKNNQGVHWRKGPHAQNMEDWHALFEFCDRYFYGNPADMEFTKGPNPGRYSYEHLINYTAP
jgi:hypothetical protein